MHRGMTCSPAASRCRTAVSCCSLYETRCWKHSLDLNFTRGHVSTPAALNHSKHFCYCSPLAWVSVSSSKYPDDSAPRFKRSAPFSKQSVASVYDFTSTRCWTHKSQNVYRAFTSYLFLRSSEQTDLVLNFCDGCWYLKVWQLSYGSQKWPRYILSGMCCSIKIYS